MSQNRITFWLDEAWYGFTERLFCRWWLIDEIEYTKIVKHWPGPPPGIERDKLSGYIWRSRAIRAQESLTFCRALGNIIRVAEAVADA